MFLAANPITAPRLRLDREIREIQSRLRGPTVGRTVSFVTRWAVRPEDVRLALLEVEPDVVHLSCHGLRSEEIVLEDRDGNVKPVGREALADLLGILRDRLRVIVLNACFSHRQAEVISEHVDCAIGMSQAIGDEAAIEFAATFYQAIGHGRSVDVAFNLARNALQLEGIPEERTPQLLVRSGIDARRVVLVGPEGTRSVSREPGEAVVQLRALGTSYAYQAEPGVDALSVGRQRRKPGGPPQGGNDVVVRIRGDAAQNLRISRRHLDIVRTDHRWYLVDRSRGHTTLNDALVPTGEPVPLRAGDRIGLAGVLVLEFSIRDAFTNVIVTGPVGIGAEDCRSEGVFMEASVGDMVTVRDD